MSYCLRASPNGEGSPPADAVDRRKDHFFRDLGDAVNLIYENVLHLTRFKVEN